MGIEGDICKEGIVVAVVVVLMMRKQFGFGVYAVAAAVVVGYRMVDCELQRWGERGLGLDTGFQMSFMGVFCDFG